mmetsp:Transcript_108486/g.233677  ORF Transcript_108486/g.233677 Transcript_108486/m.233677 type:complete len:390 (+) Transcript_108486:452-1621(+)
MSEHMLRNSSQDVRIVPSLSMLLRQALRGDSSLISSSLPLRALNSSSPGSQNRYVGTSQMSIQLKSSQLRFFMPCRSISLKSLSESPSKPSSSRADTNSLLSTRRFLLASKNLKASSALSPKCSMTKCLKPASSLEALGASSSKPMVPLPSASTYFHMAVTLPRKPISMHFLWNCFSPSFMFASGSRRNHVLRGFPKRRFVKSRNSARARHPFCIVDLPAIFGAPFSSWASSAFDLARASACLMTSVRFSAAAACWETSVANRFALAWDSSTVQSGALRITGESGRALSRSRLGCIASWPKMLIASAACLSPRRLCPRATRLRFASAAVALSLSAATCRRNCPSDSETKPPPAATDSLMMPRCALRGWSRTSQVLAGTMSVPSSSSLPT